jgi:hypothetical protein
MADVPAQKAYGEKGSVDSVHSETEVNTDNPGVLSFEEGSYFLPTRTLLLEQR